MVGAGGCRRGVELQRERAGEPGGRGRGERRGGGGEAAGGLRGARVRYGGGQARAGVPAPRRVESARTAARAEVGLAATQLDKTRIRAPRAGTVLELNAKEGEIVSPSPQPLAVVGDMSVVQVKAEVDDGDVAKIKVGQKAFVRSINYPGKDFEGTVTALAPAMAIPRIGPRGPKRPSDIEVLEMTIKLDGDVPLLPGMRVDAFVRPKN
mgnify:CR=1 FL=1